MSLKLTRNTPWIFEIFSEQLGLTIGTWNVKELSVNGP
jgi:hypothetical protein